MQILFRDSYNPDPYLVVQKEEKVGGKQVPSTVTLTSAISLDGD